MADFTTGCFSYSADDASVQPPQNPQHNWPTPQPPVGSTTMPVTVRISLLNLRLMKLQQTRVKTRVQELQNFYYLKSAELESDRFGSLNSAHGNHWMQTSTNDYFDQQHHYLINRVEHSLTLIEESLTGAKKSTSESIDEPKTSATKSSLMNPVALRILTNWYDRNREHPYPSYETAEVMAKAGNITVEQVKKWFANRRLRLGDTKNIGAIAKRRKRARTVSKDDIFLGGATKSD